MAMARSSAVSVLQRKEKTGQAAFRLTQGLIDSLAALDERIKKEAPDMEFNRNDVVEKALKDAVRAANEGLDEIRTSGGQS
jgi:hypothetical protein